MDQVLDRIAAWEAAGLIDAATAERLRAAETAQARREAGGAQRATPSRAPRRRPPTAGPRRLLRSSARASRSARCSPTSGARSSLGPSRRSSSALRRVRRAIVSDPHGRLAVAAIALTVFRPVPAERATRAASGRGRRLRALAVVHVAVQPSRLVRQVRASDGPRSAPSVRAWRSLARIRLSADPSVALLTQVALLVSSTSFAGLLLSWLESVVVPEQQSTRLRRRIAVGGPDPTPARRGLRDLVAWARPHLWLVGLARRELPTKTRRQAAARL